MEAFNRRKCEDFEELEGKWVGFNLLYCKKINGIIPKEWLNYIFSRLPKKPNAKHCCEFRTISLMSHSLKVFLIIIHYRKYIYIKKLELDISVTQFGFRNDVGTREALCAMNVFMERCLDMNVDLQVCFVAYEKAFEKIIHEKLLKIMKQKGIYLTNIQIIRNI